MRAGALPKQTSRLGLFDIEERLAGPRTTFLSPATRHFYEWWRQAGGGGVPLKRRFDITEHAQLAPNLFLVQRLPDGDFMFRLEGQEVVRMCGRSYAGERVKAAFRSEYGHALDLYYQAIATDRHCRVCVGSLAFAEKDYRRFESLDCPLSSDGQKVDYIIGVMDLVGQPRDCSRPPIF